MVIQDPQSPSRAGSLALIGGELALDFCNTSSGRGWPSHQDHLRRADDVIAWAAHARALPPKDAALLRAAIGADDALGQRLLRDALALREDIHRIAVEIAAARAPPSAATEALARVHAACLAGARLDPILGNFGWSWSASEAPVESVLGPVSLSALALLQQADLTRVKQCQGEKCGWLFFDSTKNKSRRWCEMEVCGNRAKQRRSSARFKPG